LKFLGIFEININITTLLLQVHTLWSFLFAG